METSINPKKEFIVITAIDLMHENGINNVSTKEIARRLGISESLIFKMYPKKNDLLLAVLDHFSLYDNDMFLTAKEKYEDAIEAILFYLNKFLLYYENYPAITAVFQSLDLHNGTPQIEERVREINLKRTAHLRQLIIIAIEKKQIDNSTDPDLVADIIYSTFKGMCIRWRILNYNFSLLERTDKAIHLVLKAVVNKESQ